MLTVACVLKTGGVYTAEWVSRLRDGVSRNLSLRHRFVCLSDVEVPCERIPLIGGDHGNTHASGNGWTVHPRWWSKLELFRPGLFDGPTVYFDLDTLIIGSLDRIAAYPHSFTGLADFNSRRFGSGAMAWTGDYSHIWRAFDPGKHIRHYDEVEPQRGRIGDQAYIEDALGPGRYETFQALFPGAFVSYKVDRCKDGPPKGASVVCFHGRPKQHEITTGWVPAAWR